MRTWTTKELAIINKKSVSTIRKWVQKGKIAHLPGQPDRFGDDAIIKLGLMNSLIMVNVRSSGALKRLKAK